MIFDILFFLVKACYFIYTTVMFILIRTVRFFFKCFFIWLHAASGPEQINDKQIIAPSNLFFYWILFLVWTFKAWLRAFTELIISLSFFFKAFLFFFLILFCIAFFTVFERKIMASMQFRRGPNVIGFFGLLQAFADGIKLISKETIIPWVSNVFLFFLAPFMIFVFALLAWVFIPFSKTVIFADINLAILCLFSLSTLSVLCLILGGWASNSKYAFLGALRSAAQLLSYELVIVLSLLPIFLNVQSLSFIDLVSSQCAVFNVITYWPCFIICFIAILAEVNRIPFDLPEAESELVSGYNVEYSAIGFVFFFLAEYSNLLLMSFVLVFFFFGGWLSPFTFFDDGFFWFIIKFFFVSFCFVWVRATLPRYRFDQMMFLCWKVLMPISIIIFFFYFIFWFFYTFFINMIFILFFGFFFFHIHEKEPINVILVTCLLFLFSFTHYSLFIIIAYLYVFNINTYKTTNKDLLTFLYCSFCKIMMQVKNHFWN